MKYLYFLFLLFAHFNLNAQQVKVINKETLEPIQGVAIFNNNKLKSTVTDVKGKANLNAFLNFETLYFKHLGFKMFSLKKERIKNKVYLTPLTQGLDEIVISASKFKESKRDISNKIVSLNANDITFSSPQTSADFLAQSGQVFVQKSQLGGGSPIIRGFSTNRLLISVDGVRMNTAIFRSGNVQNVISIDPFSIEKTEIILGAGSTIYGSDAIGGVMSFYTVNPQFSDSDSLFFSGQSTLRYASANEEKTGHLTLNIGAKKWAFLSQFSVSDFNDLRMGRHGPNDYLRPEYVSTTNGEDRIVKNENPLIQRFTGYSQLNFLEKISYKPSSNLDFNLGLYYTKTSKYPRYDRLTRYNKGVLRSAEWDYGPQKWFMANLSLIKTSSSSSFYDKIKSNLAFQKFKESRIERDFNSDIRSTKAEAVDAYSFNLDFEKDLNNELKVFYGTEFVYNKIHSSAHEENIFTGEQDVGVTRYPNGAIWQSSALYASLKYKPSKTLVLQSGLRFNQVYYKASFIENNSFLNLPFAKAQNNTNALTGTLGCNWFVNDVVHWRLNVSTAFRAPNIDDVGKVFDSEPGAVVVPNSNLKPEYAYGGELGLNIKFNTFVNIETALYYTYLEDALVRQNGTLNNQSFIQYQGELSQVQSIQNASEAQIHGLEIGAEVKFTSFLKLRSQYNFISGVQEENGEKAPVRHVAPMFGNTHLIWEQSNLKFDFFASYNGKLPFNRLANSEQNKVHIYALDANGNPYSPSWFTLNLKSKYQLSKNASVTASIENITDTRYRTYSSGIASAGRNLIVALNFTL